jgi:hypothetical protein
MLKPLSQYMKAEAAPRWRGILLTWETTITIVVTGVFLIFGGRLFASYPKISDITTGAIAYSSIALGFCIAGLTISLTFPEATFTLKLASGDGGTNPYSDLLFVFSWTAIAHWCAVMVMFVVILSTDGSSALLAPGFSQFRLWVVSLIAGLCVYCLCQFLITLITLSQVGSVYIKFLAEKQASASEGQSTTKQG